MDCMGCGEKSSGPCRHVNDYTCMDTLPDSLECPPGSVRCLENECVVTQWSEWSACPTCALPGELSLRTRSRQVMQPPARSGATCRGNLILLSLVGVMILPIP